MNKTNAVRILEKKDIKFRTIEYEVDENDLSAETVALKVNLPLETVFKTLVARGDKTGIIVACIPGGKELNQKAFAAISGNKKVEMVHMKELISLTGYIRGGVSPVGMKKNYPLFLDESALLHPEISISAGMRGMQVIVSPNDLIKLLNAKVCKLTS